MTFSSKPSASPVSAFTTAGSQVEHLLGFAPTGSPKNLKGKLPIVVHDKKLEVA